MANEDSSKTEDPTGKRLNEARRDGDVARSYEIDTAFFLLMMLLVITLGGPYIIHMCKIAFEYAFNNLAMEQNVTNTHYLYFTYFIYFWIILLPIGLLFIIGGTIAMVVQVGWLVTWKKLEWKWDIFNLDGLKSIFSVQGFKKLCIDLVKLAILTLITWIVVRKSLYDMLGLINLDVVNIYMFLIKLVVRIIISLLIFYAAFGVIDFYWSKFQHTEKLKMTKSEVKDEFKQMEGDPQVKRKILSLMMEESMKRMMKEIPTADVVITNPIHLAIAVRYDKAVSDAPLVVAKGKRLVAEKIKELARQYDIPIVEDKPLARLLYKHSKVGKEIDVQFYAAIAEILANIYKMKNKTFS